MPGPAEEVRKGLEGAEADEPPRLSPRCLHPAKVY